MGIVALVAVLGILALPLLGSVRDTGRALQPGCQLDGSSERFVHLVGGGESIEVRAEQTGSDPGCFARDHVQGTTYQTPGALAEVEISVGIIQSASWESPNDVVSALGDKIVLPFWSVGVGVVMVLLAAGAIIAYGRS